LAIGIDQISCEYDIAMDGVNLKVVNYTAVEGGSMLYLSLSNGCWHMRLSTGMWTQATADESCSIVDAQRLFNMELLARGKFKELLDEKIELVGTKKPKKQSKFDLFNQDIDWLFKNYTTIFNGTFATAHP
jgi:hypothetical protein